MELRKAGKSKTRADAPEYELDDSFWANAQIVFPALEGKEPVKLRIDRDVLSFFRAQGKGYQTRMNAVLRAYYEAQKKKLQTVSKEERPA